MNKKCLVRGFAIGVIFLVTLAGFVAWSNIFYTPNVHALVKGDASLTDIMKKALTHNMRVCYDWYYMHTPLRSDKAKMGDGQNDNIFNSFSKEDLLPIPTLVGNTIKDSNVSCAQSVAGYNKSGQKLTGLLSLFGKPAFDGDGSGTNMVAIGYTPVPKEGDDQPQAGKHTFKISYTYQDTVNNKLESAKSGSISATYGANGDFLSSSDACYENDGSPKKSSKMFCIDNANSNLQIFKGKLWGTINALSYRNGAPYNSLAAYQISMDEGKITFSGIPSLYQMQTDCAGQTVEDVSDSGGVTVGKKFYACSENISREFSNLKVEYKFESDESQALTHEEFEIKDFDAARQHFIDYLGAASYDSAWNANEKFTVYYSYYIARVKNDNKSNGYLSVDESACVDSLNGGILATGNSYYLPHNGKWCKVNIDDKLVVQHKTVANDEGKFAIITGTQTKMTSGKDADAFREVVRELMQIHDQIDISDAGEIGDVPEPDPAPVDPNPQPTPSEDGGGGTPNCYNSASSLGWIICPTMDIVSRATQGAYQYIKNNFLEIKSYMYETGSGAHNVWKTIRNWGNMVFVILLLFVIFSQVTGIGLDNYGIKKVLPRLIMVVVLTNLSFIICQIAIDLSNIFGTELERLFGQTLADRITTNASFDLGNFLEGIIATLFTIGAGAAGVVIAVTTWDKWLIPLLLFFLVALIGVLFCAVLLAAREAAIIILAVLSPVAIACYALPNTKKIYDRWFRMFSSMLLLFPICGALMGGGVMASRLLLVAVDSGQTVASIAAIPLRFFADLANSGDQGFFFQLVAVLVQVVPFFFIPMLVRNSFSALGHLGDRVANFGNRLGRTAAGAIRGADATKDLQRRMSAAEAARRARRYTSNRDWRGRLAGGLNRVGMSGTSDRLLNSNARTRAQSRAISLANSELIETERARANAERGLTADDSVRMNNLRENLRLQQQEEEIKAYTDRYKTSGMGTDEGAMEKEYQTALDRLMEDSGDADAMAQLVAAQRVLAKSDGGRTRMQNSLYGASARVGQARNDGLQRAANRLLDESGADIKAKNRGFFKYLSDVANGNIAQGTFSRRTDSKGGTYMASDFYDRQGDDKWSPDKLTNADLTSLVRLNERIAAGGGNGGIGGDALANLSSSAAEALSNENITKDMQPEIRNELAKMAGSYYTENSMQATNASGVNLTDAMRMGAARSTDLNSLANEIRRGSIDKVSRGRLASVAERALLEANNGNLSLGAGNSDALREIMVAAGRSTAAVDQGSSINVPHGIILPGDPGYDAKTSLGERGGPGPHIVT